MIEVIKKGNNKNKITCPNCKSLLEYGSEDAYIKEEYDYLLRLEIHKHYIICPVCHKHIKVKEMNYDCL